MPDQPTGEETADSRDRNASARRRRAYERERATEQERPPVSQAVQRHLRDEDGRLELRLGARKG